ncbi:MAG: AAA family ATPase [Candidatus Eisenbacteria sp.]|nr:AAA family ATPase [Candidatus Eisenbacteria bacterium]
MYRKEMNERSPLRVFEKSLHGGLGRGNLGVVMSRAGIGKTAFLIGVALDDLMRDRKVLHVSLEDSVERVRDFYDAIFKELSTSIDLEDAATARLLMERSRMIHSYRSGELSVEKLCSSIEFLSCHAQFKPQVVIIDGVNFYNTSNEELAGIRDLAQDLDVEMWLSVRTHRTEPRRDPRGIAEQVVRFDAHISVMVLLHDEEDGVVTIQLLKDHENQNLSDLHMKLDSTTLLLLAEEPPRLF